MSILTSNKKALAPWMKIAATGGILLGAAAIVGSGAFAVWTSSATANATINAGSVNISMSNSNIDLKGMAPGDTVQQLLTVSFPQSATTGNAVSGIKFSAAPGTEITGTNPAASGTSGFYDLSGSSLYTGSVTSNVSTTAYPDGTFNLGAVAGTSALTYTLQTCTESWKKVSPSTIYTCPGTTSSTGGGGTSLLSDIKITSPLTLSPHDFDSTASATAQTPFTAVSGSVTLYSMISITLPWTANNSFEGASLPLVFNASAVQRSGVTTAP